MSIVDEIGSVAKLANEHEFNRLELMLEGSKTEDEIEELVLHHCVSQRSASKIVGLPEKTFRSKVKEMIDSGELPPIIRLGNKYRYSLSHLRLIMDSLGQKSWRDKIRECIRIAIHTNKGGTSKTTTAIHLAAALALNVKERIRVLVIDLDPQGSLRIYAANKNDHAGNTLTAMDIAMGMTGKLPPQEDIYKDFVDAGLTHDEILDAAIMNTHIPGLDIMPSFPSDDRFNEVWATLCESPKQSLTLLRDYVVKPLSEHYDFIIMDTGPHNNAIPGSAMEACNALLIPVAPRKLDWASTCQFLDGLPSKIHYLPSGGKNLKFWKIIASNYNDEFDRDREILDQMKDSAGRALLNSVIKTSSAFEAANRRYRTIFDLAPGDCPTRQLEKANSSVADVVRELTLSFRETDWS